MKISLSLLSPANVAASCIAAAMLLIPFNSSAEDLNRLRGWVPQPYVILLRHADAPGRGEPANFDLNDCSTQRGLSDKGREDAVRLGHTLKALGVNVTKVVASRWCRARQSAELLGLGPVEENRVFDNFELNKDRSQFLLENERKMVASWQGPGVLVVVTHSSNLKALTKVAPASDTIMVAEPHGDADLSRVAQVNLEEPISGEMLY
jgi:phosphohistidine phosphatase SixA